MLVHVSEQEMEKVEGGWIIVAIGFVVVAGGLLYGGYKLGQYLGQKLSGSSVCQ